MRYAELIEIVCEDTELEEDVVRKVLDSLPEILMSMKVEEKVRTPLGTFFCDERQSKRVQLPNGNWVTAPKKRRIRIKPSSRMQRIVED